MSNKVQQNKFDVPPATFHTIVENTPLVSIDLIVDVDGKILVGERINRPARGTLFVPGGRIRKDETISQAFRRIAQVEIGLDVEITSDADFLGVFEHFYTDSTLDENTSTHYVCLGYTLTCDPLVIDHDSLMTQHRRYEFLTPAELLDNDLVHENTKVYARILGGADDPG